MGRHYNHLTAAKNIVNQYKGNEPLAAQLKKYFAANKKHGSKDRKAIAALCYAYYRMGLAFKSGDIGEKIVHALFVTEKHAAALLQELAPALEAKVEQKVEDKLSGLNILPADLFPFKHLLAQENRVDEFYLSFLRQPAVFLRLRPGKKEIVLQKLDAQNISYAVAAVDSIALQNGSKLQDAIALNKEAVLQDYSSQHVLDYLKQHVVNANSSAWDACAASGGKAILLHDILKAKIKLTVSDIRPSMLHNLQQRLQDAGINIYRKFCADLTQPVKELGEEKFDIIICDVPCSGSGTWARTPEQLFYFKEAALPTFATRQQKIVANCLPFLKPGGLFFYITCSVFEAENEAQAQWIINNHGLMQLEQRYIFGYKQRADNMFVAVFKG